MTRLDRLDSLVRKVEEGANLSVVDLLYAWAAIPDLVALARAVARTDLANPDLGKLMDAISPLLAEDRP